MSKLSLRVAGIVLLTALTGCTPDGYKSAPAVIDYVSKQLPELTTNDIAKVSVCKYVEPQDWRVSLSFDDDTLYSYRIDDVAGTVTLIRRVTPAQIEALKHQSDIDWECIGTYYSRESESFFRQRYIRYEELGRYRLHINSFTPRAYVETEWSTANPFGTEDKRLLDYAVMAVKDAVTDKKRLAANENTWKSE